MSKQKGKSEKPSNNGATPLATGKPKRLPAYFLSLSLENVRCFGPKQTLDLSDGNGKPAPWTIILGLNGTGKTTLLQSLAGFELVRLPDFPEKHPLGPRFWFDESAERSFLRGQDGASWEVELAASKQLAMTPVAVTVSRHELHSVDSGSHDDAESTSIWCCAYGAGRRFGSVSFTGSEDSDPAATLFSDTAPLRNSEEWLIQLDYAAGESAEGSGRSPPARAGEGTDSRHHAEGEITDIRLATTSGTHPRPRAEFKTPYGWVPLRQLGYGYQTLITWVADLANRMAERYPDSTNPLAEPAVVLVDEIDLHLQPVWQRKLMGFLTGRFPNTQFIATAHSPLVAQAAGRSQPRRAAARRGITSSSTTDVDNIRNWRVDQILTSELFGLKTARPPQIEALMSERKSLLTKPKRSAADKKRLAEVEAEMGELPMGETTKEIEEREKILKLLESLAKERKAAP